MSSSYLNQLLLQSLQGAAPQARTIDEYFQQPQPTAYDRYKAYQAEQAAPDIAQYAQQLFGPKQQPTRSAAPPASAFRVPAALQVQSEQPSYSEAPVLPGGYGSVSASFTGAVPYRDSASNYVRAAVKDVDKFVSDSEKAQSDQDNFYAAMQDRSAKQLESLGDMSDEHQAYLDALEKNKADQDALVRKFETLKVQPESGGKTALKAIALALGAFGSSLTGTPDRTLDIIESTARDAAQKLASDREHTANLLGLNKEEREEINERYKTKTEYAKYLENSILSYQAQRLKNQEATAKNRLEAANARLASGNIQAKIDENNANTAKEYAKLSVDSGIGKGFVPQPTKVFNVQPQIWNALDKNVAKDLSDKGVALDVMGNLIKDIKSISSDPNLNIVDKKKEVGRILKELLPVAGKLNDLQSMTKDEYEAFTLSNPTDLLSPTSSALRNIDRAYKSSITKVKSSLSGIGNMNPEIDRMLYSGGSL